MYPSYMYIYNGNAKIDDEVRFVLDQHHMLAHWKKGLRANMSLHLITIP
jgi:hypothetical protein